MFFIYKITNQISGKIYVGKSKNPHRRFREHCNSSSKMHITAAIKKHGKSNFRMDVIDSAETKEVIDAKEIYWIQRLDTYNTPHGYNHDKGGKGRDVIHGPYDVQREYQNSLVETNTHHFQSGEIQRKHSSRIQRERLFRGDHPFQREGFQRDAQLNLSSQGKHNFQSGEIQRETSSKMRSRQLVTEVKNLFKKLNLPEPLFVHTRSDEWLQSCLEELEEIKQDVRSTLSEEFTFKPSSPDNKGAIASKKPVWQILNGEKIKLWSSVTEAAESLSVSKTSITNAIRKGYKSVGFHWVY